jgi:hypothetical protein
VDLDAISRGALHRCPGEPPNLRLRRRVARGRRRCCLEGCHRQRRAGLRSSWAPTDLDAHVEEE